ncbi:MAG: hypothetical protein ACOC4L_03745 [Halanaerobium sp.]
MEKRKCPRCDKIFNKGDEARYFMGIKCCDVCSNDNSCVVLKRLDEETNNE